MIENIKTHNIQDVAQALEQAVIDNMPGKIHALLPYVTQPLLAVINIQDKDVDYFLNRDLRETADYVLKKMSATERAPDQLTKMTRQFCVYLAHLATHHNQNELAGRLIKTHSLEQECQNIAPLQQIMVGQRKEYIANQKALFEENKAMLRKSTAQKPMILRRRPRPT